MLVSVNPIHFTIGGKIIFRSLSSRMLSESFIAFEVSGAEGKAGLIFLPFCVNLS